MTYVPDTFRNAMVAHLVGNMLIEGSESPLILGIFGPPGEGKTFQTEVVCRSLGIATQVISPGELESENAGHPGQLIRSQYLQAAGMIREGRPAVVVINDIDTVLGDWGDLVQYTVNRQVVYGQLMALCDFPEEVAGTNSSRVPIVCTGNNPSLLYGPLLRPGRMRIFGWEPTAATRVKVVCSIFPEIEPAHVTQLVERYPDRPVAFWSDVRAALWERDLVSWIEAQGERTLDRMFRSGKRLRLEQVHVSLQVLIEIAESLISGDVSSRSYAPVG